MSEREAAELIGGPFDGRLLQVAPNTRILRIPVPVDPDLSEPIPDMTYRVLEYVRAGRNDAGRLRFVWKPGKP